MTAKTAPLYRLTLSPEAFALAITRKSPAAGKCAFLRPDGKWDTMVTIACADLLKQVANEGENLSDTVIRTLTKESV